MRSATLRNHNRVAARLADALGLPVRCFIDTEDPTNQRRTAHPSTISMKSDIEYDIQTRRVHMVDNGCLLHKSVNGVLYELHHSEGFWIFCGPPDTASYNAMGTIFDYHGSNTCFPTSTVKYHNKFPERGTVVSSQHGSDTKDTIYERKEPTQVQTLFPCESFMHKLENLGYNRNHGVVSLMPLVQYVSANSF
jgi:hypothetical protein